MPTCVKNRNDLCFKPRPWVCSGNPWSSCERPRAKGTREQCLMAFLNPEACHPELCGHALGASRTAVRREWVLKAKKTDRRMSACCVLTANMPPHLQAVLRLKRIKVFEAMLKETSYPDPKLPMETPGALIFLGPFLLRTVYSALTSNLQACLSIAGISDSCNRPSSPEVAKAVYEATQAEVEKGWLHGPLPPSFVRVTNQPDYIAFRKRAAAWSGPACCRPGLSLESP